jgi:hypothetical protein
VSSIPSHTAPVLLISLADHDEDVLQIPSVILPRLIPETRQWCVHLAGSHLIGRFELIPLETEEESNKEDV